MTDVRNQTIVDMIETYRHGFLTLDPRKLASIWEASHAPLVYVAQERAEPLVGWPQIERYIDELPTHLEKVSSMEIDDLSIDALGADATVAFFAFRCTVLLRGRTEPFHPTGRVTMVFRGQGDLMRVVHYHESALAHHAAAA